MIPIEKKKKKRIKNEGKIENTHSLQQYANQITHTFIYSN